MTDEILKKIDEDLLELLNVRAQLGIPILGRSVEKILKALRVAVEEIARVPACDSNSCTTCEAIAKITTILGVKEEEK